MTKTDTTTVSPTEVLPPQNISEPTVEQWCPKCHTPGKHVEGTEVWHCDACGNTWGEVIETPTSAIEKRTAGASEEISPDEARASFDQAAAASLDAAIPDHQTFLTMARTALMLSRSPAVPKALQENPYLAFHVVAMGRALNLDPATAVNLIDVIGEGDKMRLSLSPELLTARVKLMGLGSVELLYANRIEACAVALRPGGYLERDIDGAPTKIVGEIGRTCFTWRDAEEAELTDSRCIFDPQAGVVTHWKKPNSDGRGWSNGSPNGCKCRGYKTYPWRMLGWRAQGYCVHDHFPQASLGLYSPEELGAAVDEDGRAIDPVNVSLPEGYDAPKGSGSSGTLDNDPMSEQAPPHIIDWLKARSRSLPDEQRRTFYDRCQDKVQEGRIAPNINDLTLRGVNIVKALLNGQEAIAESKGWKRTVSKDEPAPPVEGAEAPPDAPSPPQTAPTTDTAPEGESTSEGANAGASEKSTKLDVGPDDEFLAQAMQIVSQMTVRQVNAGLRTRTLVVGNGVKQQDNNRVRLTVAMAKEMREQEAPING